jgi:hypothetical protein
VTKGPNKGQKVGHVRFSVAVGASNRVAQRVDPIRFLPGGRGAID